MKIISRISAVVVIAMLTISISSCGKSSDHQLQSKPSEAIVSAISAMNAGDSVGLMATFSKTETKFLQENPYYFSRILHAIKGTTFHVTVVSEHIDSTVANVGVVRFVIEATGPVSRHTDTTTSQVFFEDGKWKQERIFQALKPIIDELLPPR